MVDDRKRVAEGKKRKGEEERLEKDRAAKAAKR
jgi:hypothetical protein